MRALGGPHDAENLRVLCRAHNRLHAEEVFSSERVARRIHLRQRKSRRGSHAASEVRPATTSQSAPQPSFRLAGGPC